jgi:hypothetical protein
MDGGSVAGCWRVGADKVMDVWVPVLTRAERGGPIIGMEGFFWEPKLPIRASQHQTVT